jgi:membrane protein YqaA with SNARE-associated domain
MNEASQNAETEQESKATRIRKRLLPILSLLLVLGLAVAIFLFYRYQPERFEQLEDLGYLGVFIISLILNATVVLPAGNFVFLFVLGGALPIPVLVGVIGAFAAAIGELTSYAAGYSGQALVQKRGLYIRMEGWLRRWGSLTFFVLSAAPIFFDVAGITAGALRFPVWKYFIACFLGRALLYIGIAYAGSVGLDWVINIVN